MIETKKPLEEQAIQPSFQTHSDVVRYYIQTMDTDMLYFVLNNDITYQDMPRNEFILKLERAIEKFKAKGDTFLNAIEGRCGQCSKEKTGFLFVGNNSKMYMNLLFDLENGEIKDLYECSNFKTNYDRSNFTKRLWIDNIFGDFPFGKI
jgi:hypothetical protein